MLFDKKIIFPNDIKRLQLKGNVKEIITRFNKKIDPKYTEENINYFREDERKMYNDLYFNSLGNIIEKVNYSFFDEIESNVYFSYNSRNELKNETLKYKGKVGSIEYKFSYWPSSINVVRSINREKDNEFKIKYHIKNRQIVSEITVNGQHQSSKIAKYFENGLLKEVQIYLYKRKFFHDEDGKITRIEYCHNSGSLQYFYFSKNYFYDNLGNLIKCEAFNEHPHSIPELRESYTYVNDEYGNWTTKTITNTTDLTVIEVKRTIKYYSS